MFFLEEVKKLILEYAIDEQKVAIKKLILEYRKWGSSEFSSESARKFAEGNDVNPKDITERTGVHGKIKKNDIVKYLNESERRN